MRAHRPAFAWLLCATLLLSASVTRAETVLVSGDASLKFTANGRSVIVGPDGKSVELVSPVAADVLDRDAKIAHVTGSYQSVDVEHEGLVCRGKLSCPGGSILSFVDRYTPRANAGAFGLVRQITVESVDAKDVGFRTEIQLRDAGTATLESTEPFVPGLWYADNAHTPRSGLVSDLKQRNHLFREDRLPIPMAGFRVSGTGLNVLIVHDRVDGKSFAAENTSATVTDDRMQFASLGLRVDGGGNGGGNGGATGGVAVVLAFPGDEGDQTSVGRFHPGSSERFHPARQGLVQNYSAVLQVSHARDFDQAMRADWRLAYEVTQPRLVPLPLDRVYDSSIGVLDHYFGAPRGVPGFPFAVNIPDGRVRDVSYQMGFVGEQLPCAYHLITAGLSKSQPRLVEKGIRIVDFWATNTLTPAGVPRTWYDVDPKPHWRDYKTFTRIATDGMEGMLQAWRRLKLNGRDHPRWLACCRTFGGWLVGAQGADGSFARQYDFDGKILDDSKSATLHPVRFLIDLWYATGEQKYLSAAVRAGEYGVKDVGNNANYFGGTADNADVKDKEAGWIALDSFLALYEATQDRKWLTATDRAATFTESWVYCWNVPVDRTDPKVSLPEMKTTAGMSLIATGHSGSDVFMAFGPYAYYRLSIYLNDPHYADVAKLLMYDPRQMVDVAGSLHYGQPGLLTEATSLAPPRGHGVAVWLPWCTAAVLDPMQQFQDAFGTMDLTALDSTPVEKRRETLLKFTLHHGFPPHSN